MKVENFPKERQRSSELDGFSAALDLQPDWVSFPSPRQPPRRCKLLNKLGLARPHPFRTNRVFSYPEVVAAMLARPTVDYPRIPCVMPSWDNTARRRNGAATIFHGSTPNAYGHWLRSLLADQETLGQMPKPIVFINAWSEWAQGNHLEPDLRYLHSYLKSYSQGYPHIRI